MGQYERVNHRASRFSSTLDDGFVVACQKREALRQTTAVFACGDQGKVKCGQTSLMILSKGLCHACTRTKALFGRPKKLREGGLWVLIEQEVKRAIKVEVCLQ